MSELDCNEPDTRESPSTVPEFVTGRVSDLRQPAVEAAQHVFGFAGQFDPHLGTPLSMSFQQVLSGIRAAIGSGNRPLPFDRLQQIVDFVLPSLREVLERPRQKIQRAHVLQPIHRVREMDAKCMDWLGRQPGRNVREKLAGKTGALGVQREFSPETEENRLVAKVIRILEPLLEVRIAEIDRGDFDFRDEALERRLRECSHLCHRAIRQSVFGEIDSRAPVRPNNVLLGDRRYSRIWRAWRWLRLLEPQHQTLLERNSERFLTASFWCVVAAVGGSAGVSLSDRPCRCIPGWEEADDGFGLMLLRHDESGENRWTTEPAAGAIIEGDETLQTGRISVLTPASAAKPRAGVRDSGSRVFGFGPSALDPSVPWHELQIGQELAFRPAAGAEIQMKGAHAASLMADWVGPPRRPRTISIALCDDTISVEQSALVGSGLLNADKDQLSAIAVTISSDVAGPAECGRGNPIRIRLGDSVEINSYADIGGLRSISEAVCSFLGLRPASAPAHAVRHAGSIATSIGIDLGAALPRAAAAGEVFTPDAGFYLASFADVRGREDGTDQPRNEFLAGSVRSPCDVLSGGVQVITLASVLRSGEVPESFSAVFAALARSIDGEIKGFPAAGKAFAVPDSVDEFSQSGVRAAISGAFGEISPIWRTAATVLGWQCSGEFLQSGVKPNDVVISLDPCSDELAVAVLSARYDAALERAIPSSRGLFWERRPPCMPEDLPGDLAALMRGLTSREILSQYLAESLAPAVAQGLLAESEAQSAAWLVELGVVERVLADGAPAVVPLGFPTCDYALAIESNRDRWEKLLGEWADRLASLLPALRANELFADLLSDARGKTGAVHLLVAGSPYGITPVRTDVLNPVSRACERSGWKLHSLQASSGIASLGASEFARRRLSRQMAWVDWLPELYLEVVQDGTFTDFELMKEQIAADVAFGREAVFSIASNLQIPQGESRVSFPLFEGRSRRRKHDAWLESPSFPLAEPMAATLRLVYRFGQENPYSLEVAPVGGGKAVPIRVQFAPRRTPVSEIPEFPQPRRWSHPELLPLIQHLKDQADRFPADCERFVAGTWRPARLQPEDTFDKAIVRRLIKPLRGLWDEGRRVEDAPILVRSAFAEIAGWLDRLCGLPGSQNFAIARSAQRLLSMVHADAGPDLVDVVVHRLLHERDAWQRFEYIRMAGYLIGDATERRERLLLALLDCVDEALDAAVGGDRAFAGLDACRSMSLKSLSTAIWRHPQVVPQLFTVRPDFPARFIRGSDALLRRSESDAQRSDGIRMGPPKARAVLQTLLGLLRGRMFPSQAGAIDPILLAGSPELVRLSRSCLRTDARLIDLGMPIRSLIRFERGEGVHSVEGHLERTSELGIVLRHYLTGDDTCLVRIVGVDDEADS